MDLKMGLLDMGSRLLFLSCLACSGAKFGTEGANGTGATAGTDSAAGHGGSGGVAGNDGGGKPNGGVGGAITVGGSEPIGTAGEAGDSGTAGAPPISQCPCAAPTPTCEAGKCVSRGARMVKVGSFHVDSAEVTVESYARFLLAKGDDTSGQPPECAWNDSFARSVQTGEPKQPVTHVDFCDALAYCAWADKQLCGKIGGGTLAFADLASPTKSQWFAACGGSKGQPYPYGSAFMPNACNSSSVGVAAVESHAGCEGFATGVFDMVGNVAEWVNACDASTGAVDGCETIGGSYLDDGTCSLSSLKHRDEQLPSIGFRCCSKP